MIGTCDRRGREASGRGLGRDRRAAIALIAALAAPALLLSVAMGIEVAHWSVVQTETQRVADISALAGGAAYIAAVNAGTGSEQSSPQQQAATAAANVAELNGAAGTANRSWDASSATLSDNEITVRITSGVRNSADPAVQVSVRQVVPLGFAHLFDAAATTTLGATATSEILSVQQWNGPQPCVAALKSAAQGGAGITYTGWTTVTAIGCSIRSNANITETGSGNWNTEGLFAAGSVSIPNWVSDTDNNGNPVIPQQNAGTIPDPYASNTAMQNSFTAAAKSTGPSIACSNQNCGLAAGTPNGSFNGSYCAGQGTGSVTCTLEPGSYGSFQVTSGGPYTFNLQPGLYYFNGNVNLTNYTTTNASAVTIITTGTFTGANTFNFNLSAPTPAQAADTGGIAGIAMAGTTSGSLSVSGEVQMQITGVMYFPNATFTGQGSTTAGSSSCFELLAGSVSLQGNSGYSGTCPSLNTTPFGSTYQASSSVALVR